MAANLSSALILVIDGLVLLLVCAVISGTALSLYLLLLAIASFRRSGSPALLPESHRSTVALGPSSRFAILIPAHDEELVIGRLLESLNEINYPRHLFGVHVIADHCSDRTGDIASSLGATVHDREDPDPRGKSRSLNWLVQQLLARNSNDPIDAFVVLDADAIVSPRFLLNMDAHLRSGDQIIQGVVQIDDPGEDRIGQLRALAYEFTSYLRPLGRNVLGLSAGLRGNGMCIARDCAARFSWDTDSLTEDYELHGRLLLAGLRVAFAPDAIVRTQLPQSLAVARKQSERWERGRLDVMLRQVPTLLAHGVRQHTWACIDGAIELLTPPFSIFIALTLALFGLSLLSGNGLLIVLALTGLVAQGLYTLRGLALASARYPRIYKALLYVPVFIMWRLWLYGAVLVRRRHDQSGGQWVRTARTPTQ